ncbi:MoaD/ThiS family protein [Alicyclobacillus pomorum]|uniref:MoaD/ThiS family protein n=1 Tax=Alicyclobacillus pomorum TaxID=204470 RepID=UPI0003F6DA72|nr:MoaD/ThiS family protein [Alicyclobacillus pomorum]
MLTVKVFAKLAEVVGQSEVRIPEREAASVADLIHVLTQRYPDAKEILHSSMVARNLQYVMREEKLEPGDEIAIIPPVSGG